MTKSEINAIIEGAFNKAFSKNADYMEQMYNDMAALSKEVQAEQKSECGRSGLSPWFAGVFIKSVEAGAHIGLYAAMGSLHDLGIIKFDD